MQQDKIELYVIRDFGEKFSDTFGFIRQNWRTLFRFMLYLILPLCLVQSAGMGSYLESIGEMADTGGEPSGLLTSMLAYMVPSMLGGLLFCSLCYGLMRVYEERGGDLSDLTMKEFFPLLRRNLIRLLFVGLVYLGLVLLAVALLAGGIFVSPWVGGLLGILLLLAMFPLLLWPSIYLLEDDATVLGALAKSYRLSVSTYGGLILFVMVLTTVCYLIIMLPMAIMGILAGVKMTIAADSIGEPSGISVILIGLGLYLWGIVSSFVSYAGCLPLYIGLAYQYGHAAEKVDHASVTGDIERFEEMAEQHEDAAVEPSVDDFDRL